MGYKNKSCKKYQFVIKYIGFFLKKGYFTNKGEKNDE